MGHSDYPLQALLYAAVLHRFLRWRQPGYDPARHLGGVLYLYLRGMCGPDTPLVDGSPCGVFAWRPPVAWSRRSRTCSTVSTSRTGGMTELFEPVGEHDWRLTRAGRGLLAAFNAGRLLTASDIHVAPGSASSGASPTSGCCSRWRSLCAPYDGLGLPRPRHGPAARRSCLARPGPWVEAVRRPRSSESGALRWDLDRLYLDRYHRLETQVFDDLTGRAARPRPTSTSAG